MGIFGFNILLKFMFNGLHLLKYIKNNWVFVEITAVVLTFINYSYNIKFEDEKTLDEKRELNSVSVLF